MIKFVFFGMAVVILTMACSKENEQTLIQETLCQLDTLSYSKQIRPIVTQRCLPCHDNLQAQGGYILDNYSDISAEALNGVLLGVIRHENGYSPMPKDAPSMPACEISAIEKWIAQGAPNN